MIPPQCVCGKNRWQSGGAMFSSITQVTFSCESCGRACIYLDAHGCTGFLLPTDQAKGAFTHTNKWFSEVLLVTWRARLEELRKIQHTLEEQAWKAFRADQGISEDAKFQDQPKAVQDTWRRQFSELRQQTDYVCPRGFEKTPTPPLLPAALTMYVLQPGQNGTKHKWELVDRQLSQTLEVPPDPIRVAHDKYYEAVFSALKEKTGISIERKIVPNQYCGASNEPWYQFMVGDVTFTVGPRKRVTAICVASPGGISTDEIRRAAMKDNVTYYAFTADDEGGWQSELNPATRLEVHAWYGTDQLERYLTILLQAARPSFL